MCVIYVSPYTAVCRISEIIVKIMEPDTSIVVVNTQCQEVVIFSEVDPKVSFKHSYFRFGLSAYPVLHL